MAVITLLTDFGEKDYYVGLFKGDLYTANPSSKIVDISHAIPPYDIVTAAFFLKNVYEHFPKGTIHIARVYEQGVKMQKLLAAKYKNYFFIAPDNGLLTMVFDEKPDLIVEVDMKQAKLNTLEEYYCRVVKEISFNHNIGSIGIATSNYVQKHALLPVIQENSIVGNIMYVDNFGNVITNIKKDEIQRFSKYNQMHIHYRRGDSIDRIVENYMDVPRTYSLARFNSLGYLELCVHGDSASDLLGLSVGNNIQVVFE
ncbi:MAG TPA: SAM-dependent chlorinase/fluorinase [Chitinophagales bacterium]|nr:SAM-dependent chlorinase/fluorinase [Chitinophagales bacterium]HNM32455.1 SAM-dependent chlorinase/fluorinase [Chitinophagales bacterium]